MDGFRFREKLMSEIDHTQQMLKDLELYKIIIQTYPEYIYLIKLDHDKAKDIAPFDKYDNSEYEWALRGVMKSDIRYIRHDIVSQILEAARSKS